jgi:fructose-1-phosphate kinase PfkB-like protein
LLISTNYKAVGINTISVFLQGSSGGFSDPFLENGKSIDPAHWQRMVQIIEACQQRDMVVVVGIFYQRAVRRHLASGICKMKQI